MTVLVKLADCIRSVLERIAFLGGWLLVVLTMVTCASVIGRKLDADLPFTKMQELEWHLHAAIFSFWMGYNYVINAHPRVDSFTENLSQRHKAWIELVGCLTFAIPYIGLVAWFSVDFAASAFVLSERSESSMGLTHRWIIKTVYAAGLWLVLIAIVSVLMRLVAVLFGGVSSEQAGLQIGHSELEV